MRTQWTDQLSSQPSEVERQQGQFTLLTRLQSLAEECPFESDRSALYCALDVLRQQVQKKECGNSLWVRPTFDQTVESYLDQLRHDQWTTVSLTIDADAERGDNLVIHLAERLMRTWSIKIHTPLRSLEQQMLHWSTLETTGLDNEVPLLCQLVGRKCIISDVPGMLAQLTLKFIGSGRPDRALLRVKILDEPLNAEPFHADGSWSVPHLPPSVLLDCPIYLSIDTASHQPSDPESPILVY